jgi:hypothetical protein
VNDVFGERKAMGREPVERGGIAEQMSRMVDGFSRLVTHHLALARLELSQDARAVGRDLAMLAAFAPFLLVGYVLVCIGLGFALEPLMGLVWGFMLVGALNLVAGGMGLWWAARRLKEHRPMLENSMEEIRSSAALLAHPGEAPQGKELDHARPR